MEGGEQVHAVCVCVRMCVRQTEVEAEGRVPWFHAQPILSFLVRP